MGLPLPRLALLGQGAGDPGPDDGGPPTPKPPGRPALKLVARPAWGAAPAKGRPPIANDRIRGVAVHYSGMNADEQRAHANCAGRVRAMQRYHIEDKDWLDVAYSHIFCGHGYVYVGRGFGVRSAANGTNEANDAYYAVCFLGDDTAGRADVTPEASRALEQLLVEYRRRYPRATEVRPHSDFVATACPGDELRALISRLRR